MLQFTRNIFTTKMWKGDQMKAFILENDRYQMNWVEGNTEWGTVKCRLPLEVSVKSERKGDIVREEYSFTNHTDKHIFTRLTDIGIYATFNDDYEGARVCMTQRCHTHIWCGGEVSYVMALRMGGEAPHMGLILTEGSLGGYSVERDIKRGSNDRGDFILHPEPFSLAPGETYQICWTLFPHNGKEDFLDSARKYSGKFIEIQAEKYVVFAGEEVCLKILPAFDFDRSSIRITEAGREVPFTVQDGAILVKEQPEAFGEKKYIICVNGVHTWCKLLSLPTLKKLAEARCRFIVRRQQYQREGSPLSGAYLTYDNEEGALFYAYINDYNGGRERVGMGALIALYLQKRKDDELESSLQKYIAYVERELVDETTGEVYNDFGDNSYHRRYNAPWFALFFIELYKLYGEKKYLNTAYRIVTYFYQDAGASFYPIELPAVDLAECLEKEGMTEELEAFKENLKKHADFLLETGTDYPASEVVYEQSIVAPAADVLFKTWLVTGEEKYLKGGKEHMAVLELFNGLQPDHHLHEVAIRHWDGFWFGKRKRFGDTFPHYWSSLTGSIFSEYAKITTDSQEREKYSKKAENSLRGTLSMFLPDGSATCAYIYPVTVNGMRGKFADPYVNDQDWGMYYALKNLPNA